MADPKTLARELPDFDVVPGDGFTLSSRPGLCAIKVQVRGDAIGVLAAAVDTALPDARRWVSVGDNALCWMAPDEYLLLGPDAATGTIIGSIQKALAGQRALITDLTHARTVFAITGDAARTALAAHCPLDLSDAAFPCGSVARTLLGETVMMIVRNDDINATPDFTIIVDQTMTQYVVRLFAARL